MQVSRRGKNNAAVGVSVRFVCGETANCRATEPALASHLVGSRKKARRMTTIRARIAAFCIVLDLSLSSRPLARDKDRTSQSRSRLLRCSLFVLLAFPNIAHAVPGMAASEWDDDGEWQTMPVLYSKAEEAKLALDKQWKEYREDPDRLDTRFDDEDDEGAASSAVAGSSRGAHNGSHHGDEDDDDDDDANGDVLERHRRRLRLKAGKGKARATGTRVRIVSPVVAQKSKEAGSLGASTNATGNLIDFDDAGAEWREKGKMNESDYTRLELDEDPDEDEVHTRTQYLFDDDKGMTPLAQMQTTKTMLSEGQRIAYVGLCRLATREMANSMKGLKELEPAVESMQNWATKIMGRLYQHMEIEPAGASCRVLPKSSIGVWSPHARRSP